MCIILMRLAVACIARYRRRRRRREMMMRDGG